MVMSKSNFYVLLNKYNVISYVNNIIHSLFDYIEIDYKIIRITLLLSNQQLSFEKKYAKQINLMLTIVKNE